MTGMKRILRAAVPRNFPEEILPLAMLSTGAGVVHLQVRL